MAQNHIKQITFNRKALHDYYIEEKFEAGIELVGTEVKSLRQAAVNLRDAYCQVENGQLFVRNMHISPYEKGNIFNHNPVRPRRLLMHKREIRRLHAFVQQDGLTLIPLQLYFKGSIAKVEVALCRGKKLHDKRASAAASDARREIARNLRERSK
jgi:SsrA-binding protein